MPVCSLTIRYCMASIRLTRHHGLHCPTTCRHPEALSDRERRFARMLIGSLAMLTPLALLPDGLAQPWKHTQIRSELLELFDLPLTAPITCTSGLNICQRPAQTPHVLRHTFGTRWLQAGGDIYKLSKILGHSSVAVTEAHYAHLLKEDLVAASQQVKIPVAPRGTGNVVRMPRRASN